MPGCAFSVFVNSGSGPAKHTAARSYPNAALARSNQVLADGNFSARSRPMPTTCAPCPANNNAVLLMITLTKHKTRLGESADFKPKRMPFGVDFICAGRLYVRDTTLGIW